MASGPSSCYCLCFQQVPATPLPAVESEREIQMVFLTSKQTPSSITDASIDNHHHPETLNRSAVPKGLRLKLPAGNDRGRQTLEKNLVLRRLRRHRWANHVRDAVQASYLRLADARSDNGWVREDPFSSP